MEKHRSSIRRCIAGIATVAILLGIFLRPTGAKRDSSPEPVDFSVPSGFYDEEFQLELAGNGGRIYYTLDATEPDENALLYDGPIRIRDASENDNVYSAIAAVSPELVPGLVEKNGVEAPYQYVIPDYKVDKATVVRAVCVDRFGNKSPIATAVYFVGFGEKKGYDGLKIMTVTTDPSNLFDDETGIYVLGKVFEDSLKDGLVTRESGRYLFWDANYREKGDDWERRASVCCFNENGEMLFSGDFGLRIQGRGTRACLPKSLNLFGRKRYGSPSIDGAGLFGVDYALDRVNLCGEAHNISMLRNYLANRFAADLDIATREYEPCALFLDGEYWGLYWLTPRYKEDYISQRYGVNEDNIVEIKRGYLEVGRDGDETLYEEMARFIADNDMRNPENYEKAGVLVDIDSCIDYYALEIYLANPDWPSNNIALWRTRVLENGIYGDCKWRWMLFDVDLAMNSNRANRDVVKQAANLDAVFASLMENEDFSAAMYARLVSLATDTFEAGRVESFIDAYKARFADPIVKKYERFLGNNKTVQDFYEMCDETARFFRDRNKYILAKYSH